MTRRYSFTITRVSTGVVEIHVPDDGDSIMDGTRTEKERDAIRLESAIGDIQTNSNDMEDESYNLGKSKVTVAAVETKADPTHDPL